MHPGLPTQREEGDPAAHTAHQLLSQDTQDIVMIAEGHARAHKDVLPRAATSRPIMVRAHCLCCDHSVRA